MPQQDWFTDNAPKSGGGDWFASNAPSSQTADTRNWFQKGVDALSNVTPEQRAGHSALTNAAQDFGARVIGDIAGPIAHPQEFIQSLPKALVGPGGTGMLGGVVQGTAKDFNENGAAVALPHLAADLGTAYATGEAIKEAAAADAVRGAAGKAASAVGGAAQDAGTGLINKTVGTLKSDFKRGANPGRGYLETGNGPSLSMQSVADKAAASKAATGQQLGAIYQKATDSGVKIPVDVVAQEMAKPIQKAIDLETGPGGTGNLSTINSYVQQFGPAFDKAAQNGGFTPSELFEMKRSIAQNTNWSDPAQFNLKAVRQQQAGALSGILSDAIPETADLNQTYQDLTKLVNRAQERANTGSRPLTAHIYKAGMTTVGALAGSMEGHALAGAAAGALLDSVPAKTTIASGLFRGGKALSSLGERLAPSDGATVEGVSPNDLGGNGANNKPGNPQLTPPPTSSNPTTATQKWAEIGAQKVIAHLGGGYPGLTPEAITEAVQSPKGKQLLIQASSLSPGTPVMDSVVKKIAALEPSSATETKSWVAVDKATGEAVMETFSKKTADKVNTEKYDVVPIGEYLGNLNKQIKEASTSNPSPAPADAATALRGRVKGKLKPAAQPAPAPAAPAAKIESPLDKFEAEGKSPYEITQKEWVDLQRAHRRAIGQSEESGTKYAPNADYEEFHKDSVKTAVRMGLDVPQKVLADYPELKPKTTAYSPEVTKTEGVEARPIPAGAQQLTANIQRAGTPKNFEGEYLKAALEPARAAWEKHLENVPDVGFTKPITTSGRKSLSAQLLTEDYPRPSLKLEANRGGDFSVVFEDYHTPEGSQQPIKVRQVIGNGLTLEAAKKFAEARLRSGQMINPGEPFYNNSREVPNVNIQNTGTLPDGFTASKLVVQVPGDGRFTIPNNITAIEGAMKRADNFVPPKAASYNLPRVPKAPATFDEAKHIFNLKRQIEESETDLRRAQSKPSQAMQVPFYQQQLDAARSELQEILNRK